MRLGASCLPLPLAGEVDARGSAVALPERGGWGKSIGEDGLRRDPHNPPPQEREGRSGAPHFTSEHPPSAIGRNA